MDNTIVDEWAVINVRKSTKERFDKLGNVSMSRDDVLKALIDVWEKYQTFKTENKEN